MICRARRIHADAGHLARDPHLQPGPHGWPRRRHRDHAVAQSAATTAGSSTTRRTAARPDPTSPSGSRTGPTNFSRTACGRAAHAVRRSAAGADTHTFDYVDKYVERSRRACSIWTRSARAGLKLGVDPLGGAGVDYWQPIADRYKLDLDGGEQGRRPHVPLHDASIGTARSAWIRSSPYAMQG